MIDISIIPMLARIANYYRSRRARLFQRRIVKWPHSRPFISFTFDDFPTSAYLRGARILDKYCLKGTYFISLGLLGRITNVGAIANYEVIYRAIEEGHEIGCHTYDHYDAWCIQADLFERSIIKNIKEMRALFPQISIRSFAYPRAEPHPRNKNVCERYFDFCRGGGQKSNLKNVDLNLLNSCFLDYKNREDMPYFKRLIQINRELRGWLIFSTHDLSENPSPFGINPRTFEQIVNLSLESGANITPIIHMKDYLLGKAREDST